MVSTELYFKPPYTISAIIMKILTLRIPVLSCYLTAFQLPSGYESAGIEGLDYPRENIKTENWAGCLNVPGNTMQLYPLLKYR